MFRLLAIIPKYSKAIISDALLEFRKLAECGFVPEDATKGHKDGWGIGAIKNKLIFCEKNTGNALTDKNFENFIKTAQVQTADVIMAHLRKASVGGVSINNTHPFIYKGFVFCHNGSIFESHKINLKPKFANLVKGETDSEKFFLYLMQIIEDGGSLEQAINFVKGHFDYKSINFLLSNGGDLWAQRETRVHFDYYTLYQSLDSQTGTILICSEKLPLAGIVWQEILNHQLVQVKI